MVFPESITSTRIGRIADNANPSFRAGRRKREERLDLEGRQFTRNLLQTEKCGVPWVHGALLRGGAIASPKSGAASSGFTKRNPTGSHSSKIKCTPSGDPAALTRFPSEIVETVEAIWQRALSVAAQAAKHDDNAVRERALADSRDHLLSTLRMLESDRAAPQTLGARAADPQRASLAAQAPVSHLHGRFVR